MTRTIGELVDLALEAEEALAALGEEIDDEWSYVTDLEAAWRDRLELVASGRGDEPADPTVVAAVDRAIEETRLVKDPHRAIDWLSTFPQIVLVAMGEQP